jgi:hypothetical protein
MNGILVIHGNFPLYLASSLHAGYGNDNHSLSIHGTNCEKEHQTITGWGYCGHLSEF